MLRCIQEFIIRRLSVRPPKVSRVQCAGKAFYPYFTPAKMKETVEQMVYQLVQHDVADRCQALVFCKDKL